MLKEGKEGYFEAALSDFAFDVAAGNQQKAGEGIAELSGRGMEVLFFENKRNYIYTSNSPSYKKRILILSRFFLACARGFEPPTFWSVAKRSIQLS